MDACDVVVVARLRAAQPGEERLRTVRTNAVHAVVAHIMSSEPIRAGGQHGDRG